MTGGVDREHETRRLPWWMLLPFVEQLFVLILFGLLAPGAWAIWLLSRGGWLLGLIVLTIWIAIFGRLALFLHQRHKVRLLVSIPSAGLVLAACVAVFFAP